MLRISRLLVLAFIVFLAGMVGAQDAPKEIKKKVAEAEAKKVVPPSVAPLKKATHKVEKGPFKVEVSLKGVLEAASMTEVNLSPEAFTPENRGQFRVLKAVEHGSHVRKGDQLLWLDMERIDNIITDLERDRELAELGLKLADEEMRALEKAAPLDLAAAERGKKLADEDLKRFLTLDKDFLIKMAHYEVKSANDWLNYAKEELRQLEKMYKANDLTEATEEIILRRQRDGVERATMYVKFAEHDRDNMLKVIVPRREEGLKDSNSKQTLTLEKAKITFPLLLNQKKLTLDKMKFERERTVEKLQKFKKDRDAMLVKAPADGIVYLGKCFRGQWSSAAMESRLQRGSNLMPDEVIMTVVKSRPVFVRAAVEEKDLGTIRAGLKGKVIPAPLPDLKLGAKVERIAAIPTAPGSFDARIALDDIKEVLLMPGMACTVKLTTYQKADALTLPSSAVFADENDEDIHFVYVQGKGDKHAKVYVTPGKKSGARTEILQGVKEGDQVLLEKPAPTQK